VKVGNLIRIIGIDGSLFETGFFLHVLSVNESGVEVIILQDNKYFGLQYFLEYAGREFEIISD